MDEVMDEPDRYLHDLGKLQWGDLVEIDPGNPASLAAFRDASYAQGWRQPGETA